MALCILTALDIVFFVIYFVFLVLYILVAFDGWNLCLKTLILVDYYYYRFSEQVDTIDMNLQNGIDISQCGGKQMKKNVRTP